MIPEDVEAEREVVAVAVATRHGARTVRSVIDPCQIYRPDLRRLLLAAFELDDVDLRLRSSEIRASACALLADVPHVQVAEMVAGRTFMHDPGRFADRVRLAARQRQALLEHRERARELEEAILRGDLRSLGCAS